MSALSYRYPRVAQTEALTVDIISRKYEALTVLTLALARLACLATVGKVSVRKKSPTSTSCFGDFNTDDELVLRMTWSGSVSQISFHDCYKFRQLFNP